MPSPHEASNGFPQPSASGTWHKPEEEARLVEAGLVKKAHREILDHERKRRVELKCMELQEMMEEQGKQQIMGWILLAFPPVKEEGGDHYDLTKD
ncbi:UNVERIFIED_CONTAM: Serine/arginine repetitive matrix protein 3 [Gekko kuhli]